MINLGLTLTGEKELEEALGKLSDSVNTKEILDESGALILNRIRTRFLSQTDPEGHAWEPSKASYRRARTGVGGGTLFDTGRLFHSIQIAHDGENGRVIGTDVGYAGFVNFGTVRLPPRIFMDFNAEDVDLVLKLLVLRVERALT